MAQKLALSHPNEGFPNRALPVIGSSAGDAIIRRADAAALAAFLT
jgi:hypothetical protein